MENKYICEIPTWALSYLVNDDPSGLDDNDKTLVDSWKNDFNGHHVVSVSTKNDEVYFSHWPEFGLPYDVQDCYVVVA